MVLPVLTEARLQSASLGAFFRPRDLVPLGYRHRDLGRLVASGIVAPMGAGLYRLAAVDISEFETIAMVAAAVPRGVVCLLSALRVHEIGTQSPREVWIALDRKARKPVRVPSPVRFVRSSGASGIHGVVTRPMLGVPVRITSPARTVVDCFRYRNKFGIDVAMEALRDSVRSRKASVDEILRLADLCRARTVIRPYLEALAP
jgi:predicted transcriptional regulator of viral defense system